MKLSDLKAIGERIEIGDWIGDLPQLPGVRLKVRGIGNRDWRILRERYSAAGRTTADREFRQAGELIARTILLDWDGLQNDDGSDLVYSRERAEQLLQDPAFLILRDSALYAASRVGSPPVTEEAA